VRLCRLIGRVTVAAAVGLSSACGGCSYQLHSLGTHKDTDSSDPTGSIAQRSANGLPVSASGKPSIQPSEFDLAYARAAVSEVLTRGGKDTSVPWENPQTGARGNITPLASNYKQDGFTCRDFLASYMREGSEAWLQGEACRMTQGKWEVKTLRPWKQT
jgi:surface antigen